MELNSLCDQLNAVLAIAKLNVDYSRRPSYDCRVLGNRIDCPGQTGDAFSFEYLQLADGRWICDCSEGVQTILSNETAVVTDFAMIWLSAALCVTHVDGGVAVRLLAGIEDVFGNCDLDTGRDEWLEEFYR